MYIKNHMRFIHFLEKSVFLCSFFFTLQDCCTCSFSYVTEGLYRNLFTSYILENTVSIVFTFM